jgi:hypothetical protein
MGIRNRVGKILPFDLPILQRTCPRTVHLSERTNADMVRMVFNRHALNSINIHILSQIQHIPLIGPNEGRQVARTWLISSIGPLPIFHIDTNQDNCCEPVG